jgi:SSS family solute:Na+ symporter
MEFAINLQLLGGVLVLQTLPAIVFGLWQRLFHHVALLAGWAAGLALAAVLLAQPHLQSSAYPLRLMGQVYPVYVGILALVANLLVTALGSVALDRMKVARAKDGTAREDYVA